MDPQLAQIMDLLQIIMPMIASPRPTVSGVLADDPVEEDILVLVLLVTGCETRPGARKA